MLNAAQAALARRLQAREPNITLRVNPPGVEKMSEVLLHFADPILDRSAPLEEIRDTLFFAMTLWNYALLPAEARSDDGTIKALFHTADSRPLEAVLMRYRDGRRSVCLSSQSGCPLTCSFCATGSMTPLPFRPAAT